jgi:FecR-like protein
VGLFSSVLPAPVLAQVFGSRPERLPSGQSIYRLSGAVTVNGAPATLQTPIRPGDTIATGPDSEIVFVVGEHSMILRSNSRLGLAPAPEASLLLSGLRLLTGALLSVSRKSQIRVETSTATIGVRGTGWYAESDPDLTYFCTCYGVADIAKRDDPASSQTVAATHHDRPLYIVSDAQAGQGVRDAPFINHTDQELMLIETLVGRTAPFVFPGQEYDRPRRDYE